jgi:hypothetical protein
VDQKYIKALLWFGTGFQFDYVFDWTILKYQQSQSTGGPQRVSVGLLWTFRLFMQEINGHCSSSPFVFSLWLNILLSILIQIRSFVPNLFHYFWFQSLLTTLWCSYQTEAFVLSFFQPAAGGTSSGAGAVVDHASGLCCDLFNLGMNYVHATTKILLVLKSCLIQNSWTQIVDVLVSKVIWDCLMCPILLQQILEVGQFALKWSAMVLHVGTWHYE